jgi:hypothetical protein
LKTSWWRIALLSLAIALGVVYLLTIAPGLTWANRGADGGDLITAAATGGVPHPSGYPTYLLVARLFQYLPLGTLAFRTNLMSAFFAILAAVLVADLTRRSVAGSPRTSRIAGLLAGLGFGLSPLLWSQALITEVYTLHVFFVALILWLMVLRQDTQHLLSQKVRENYATCHSEGVSFTTEESPSMKTGDSSGYSCTHREELPQNNTPGKVNLLNLAWLDRLGGLVFGLALGNQITVIFLLPFWLVNGLFKDRENLTPSRPSPWHPRKLADLIHWRPLARRVVYLLLGLSIYLIIPLRARSGSPIIWGNPVDWKGLWWLVSGSLYQDRVFRLGWEYVWPRLRTWAGILQNQFGLPGLAVGVYGLLYGRPKRRGFYLLTGWMMLTYSVFAIGYNSSDSYTLLLPAFLAFALWFGLGCATILEQIGERPWHKWGLPVGIGLLATLMLVNAGSHYTSVDASKVRVAEAFVETVFAAAPENAILLSQEDRDSFALWYYHYALGERQDLAVLVQPHLSYDWYRGTLESVYPDLILPGEGALSPEIFKELNRRPVCRVELEEGDFLCPTCAQAKGSSDVLECIP